MEIFLQNLERIAEHNIRYRNGEVTYTLGMNRFGDLTHPEFVARFNGYKSNGLAKKAGKTFMKPANFQAPASMDWRRHATRLRLHQSQPRNRHRSQLSLRGQRPHLPFQGCQRRSYHYWLRGS